MILDMSDALEHFEQQVIVKTVVTATVDFVPSTVVTGRRMMAVVQPADRQKITKDNLDNSLRYIEIHARDAIGVGQVVEYGGSDWKVVQPGHYGDYGFFDVIAQQCKAVMRVDEWNTL